MEGQRVRIKLRSSDISLIDKSVVQIVDKAKLNGTIFAGPVPLPTIKNKYTVLKAPNIDKKSREQFEIRVYRRLLDLIDPNQDTIDALMRLELPAGVEVEIGTKDIK